MGGGGDIALSPNYTQDQAWYFNPRQKIYLYQVWQVNVILFSHGNILEDQSRIVEMHEILFSFEFTNFGLTLLFQFFDHQYCLNSGMLCDLVQYVFLIALYG